MQTIHSPRHAGHSGNVELMAAVILPAYELPARAEIIRARVVEVGLGPVREPDSFPLDAARRVHRPDYVDFLCRAHDMWLARGRTGTAMPFVWPVPGLRRDRPPEDIEGLLGYYAFDGGATFVAGTWDAIRASHDTALTAAALLKSGRPADDPVVAKALKYLEGRVKADGGVYDQRLANYTTCLAIVAFQEANTGGKYDAVIANAVKFVKSIQQGQGLTPDDPAFGGVGYEAKRGRPDLSNTQFFVEALLAAGVSKDDPAVRNAVAFVGRAQNLPGEFNQLEYAKKAGDDDRGGFVYSPTQPDNKEKQSATGGLRSEGGMTYAGLKSFLYAGVAKDDQRVQAARKWIERHYTLEQNPGMGTAGLFYYYHTFAKAMDAFGEKEITDSKGVKHDWKAELVAELKKRQNADGTWANSNQAFMESSPELATAFAVLALSYCK